MKMIAPCSLRAYPSVKGIYTAISLIFFTASAFSQSNKWEFGVGLRPLTMKEDPYSFILKKYLSNKVAFRLGASFIYNKNSQNIYYQSVNPTYSLSYHYIRINKNMYINSFVGLQYGKKLKKLTSIFLYGATDILGSYTTENGYLGGDGFVHYGNTVKVKLLPNQIIETAFFPSLKTIKFSIRQSIGIQYFITSSYSISIEGGVFYEFKKVIKDGDITFLIGSDGINPNPYIGGSRDFPNKYWDYSLSISPLSVLAFNYHF